MTEYRVEFKESELSHIGIPENILSILRSRGKIREVISGTRYYWSTAPNAEGIIDLFSEHKGVSITRLQGEMLR